MCNFPRTHDREKYTADLTKLLPPDLLFIVSKTTLGICPSLCEFWEPEVPLVSGSSVPMLCPDVSKAGAEPCLQKLVGGWIRILAPCSSSSPHALVRLYYFLSSNCHSQLIISLWRENNIGSYVIATSMNLEVIMEWVDFFSLLKKREKNKFEIVCICLRIFMNSSPFSSLHILPSTFVCSVE